MELLQKKVADVLAALPEEKTSDVDALISTCLVKGLDTFSKVNKIILASRNKALTPSKVEDVGRELSRALFYVACLLELLSIQSTDEFLKESLEDCTMQFDPVYHQDAIMCSMSAIEAFTKLVESIYIWDEIEDSGDPSDPAVLEEGPLDGDEDKLFQLTSIATCVYILCERLDLEYDNLQYNALLIDSI